MALFADSFLKVTISITILSNKSLTLKLGVIPCQERYWLIIHQMKSLKENWIKSIKQLNQKCSIYYCNLRLKDIEPDLLVFYNYPKQIRPSIYSTNMIESFNNVVKRKAKPKAEFPSEQSLDTFIGIQAISYNDRYFNRIHKGFGQVQDTLESYFD